MTAVNVLDKNGKKIESIKLNEKIFDKKVNKPLLTQVIQMYLANQRTGSAKVKDRSEVRGGGKKPWRQKGTGRARVGSIRSPLWRSGGVTFGPQSKDWHYQLPKIMKKKALISSLNAKLKEESIVVLDEIKAESHKTKDLLEILKKLKLSSKKLIIISDKKQDNLLKAARNMPKVELSRLEDVTAYQLLVNDKLLIEKSALERLEKNLAKVK